jgi:hypothetical protein
MKKLLASLISVLILFSFGNCKKSNNTNTTPGQTKIEYGGQTVTKIRYYEYNVNTGQDDFIEEKQYTYNSAIFVNPPMELEGVTESNPFSLQIYPDRSSNNGEEGHLDISSCIIVNDMFVGKVILQFWNYTVNGEQISGTLTDNHIAESAAANILWAWDDVAGMTMTMPFYLSNGATMTGTITNSNISLNITGQSTDTYRKFTCQINATSK